MLSLLSSAIVELPTNRVFIGVYDKQSKVFDNQRLDVEMDYVSWEKPWDLTASISDARQRGRVSLMTIEPWTTHSGNLDDVLTDTNQGFNDAIIQADALAVKAQAPQIVLIRFAHEMDLVSNYPWSREDYGSYIAAYMHYHDIFVALGATNVKWVWSPAGNLNAHLYYPGDEYVDYVGVTVLGNEAWDMKHGSKEGRSFASLFGDRYAVVSRYNKPIIVAELGVAGVSTRENTYEYKKNWLRSAFDSFSNYPLLVGVIYFNAINAPNTSDWGQPDWCINYDQLLQLIGQVALSAYILPWQGAV
jgi:endoglucanase